MKVMNKTKRFLILFLIIFGTIFIVSSIQWFIRESRRTYISTELKNNDYTEVDVSNMTDEEIEALMGGGE